MDMKEFLANGQACLGIELGSTRIKAVLIGPDHAPIASGDHSWENRYEGGYWTYSLEDVWAGLQDAYAHLSADVEARYGVKLTRVASMGFSAMMHGYLPFGHEDQLLAPFRTWRNTTTGQAAEILSERFNFNIPQRWSIAHLYQAILNGEDHVPDVAFITTLAGYVHWKLTGENVLGVGDASGVFPIDSNTCDYDQAMVDSFDALVADKGYSWKLRDILPRVAVAGDNAGTLTAEGAKLLDPTGTLQPGAILCPPEGDAGTGMAATNAVAKRTGNVSAGTSVFSMIVLEKPLSRRYEEIDMVTTPAGDPVAMIHTNNCTTDLDAWLGLFSRFAELLGHPVGPEELYSTLFRAGAEGEADAGGVLSYNYISGEHQTGVPSGRPLLVREQNARFTLENFMRAQLYGAFGALAVGMDALLKDEGVQLDVMFAHGGIFRTAGVAQQVLADAIATPVAVGESAGEGGAWGMALLAAFTAARQGAAGSAPASLSSFLAEQIFASQELSTLEPQEAGMAGHAQWLDAYRAALPVERHAGELLA